MPAADSVVPSAHPRGAPDPGHIGLILPTFPQERAALPSAPALAELCRRAEAGGAGALWACDHLFWHGPALEALAALGVAATATRHAAIGTCVLQLPLRHAPSVAKEAASLAHLSGDRLVLGVGVGTHRGEYAAAGVDFAERGRRLDEGIDTLRRAWAVSPGERYAQLPAPGPVPVWVGGSSESALRRAARLGDGWIPLFVPPADYAAALGRLDKEAERAGRDPGSVVRATVAFVSVGTSGAKERGLSWMASLYGIAAHSFERHLVTGTARSCAEALVRFTQAGAAARGGLRHFRRPAGTVRGPGRRVRRPPRVPPGPPGNGASSPAGRSGTRRQRHRSGTCWRGGGHRRRYTGQRPGLEVRSSCYRT